MKGKALLLGWMCAGITLGILAQDAPLKLKVVTDQANIRKEPDIGSPIVHMAPQGTVLEGESKEGEWYRVSFISDRGQVTMGFVHESLVIVTSRLPEIKQPERPPAEPPPPPLQKPPPVQPEKEPPVEIIPPTREQQADAADPPPSSRQQPRLRLSLGMGGSYRTVGDLNTGAQGLADYSADVLASQGDTAINPLHLTWIFGAEFQGELLPGLFLGVGLDYLKGSRESGVFYSVSAEPATYTARPEISALPLRLNLSYFFLPRFYIKGGIEYYLAHCRYYYRLQQSEAWEEWAGEASSQGMGFMAGLGLNMDISAGFSFFAELSGHLAKLRDFEGTDIYSNSGGGHIRRRGDALHLSGSCLRPDLLSAGFHPGSEAGRSRCIRCAPGRSRLFRSGLAPGIFIPVLAPLSGRRPIPPGVRKKRNGGWRPA